MPAQLLDGVKIAARLTETVKKEVETFQAKHGVRPGLTVIIVGEDPASKVYVNRKHKACAELGIASEVVRLPADIAEAQLLQEIDRLNGDPKVNGILVQLPVPKHINAEKVLEQISPKKDVDGFHPVNVGNLTVGKEWLVPCTPYGIVKMLEISGISIEGKQAVVLGRSNIVGKPMAMLLLSRNATVTVCHSKTQDLASVTRQGDIFVAAVGKPEFVTKDMVKPGAAVIDVGINRVGDKLVGDVKFDEVKEVAGYITPVPGGVGPLTIAMLLHNTVKAAQLQLGDR
ncbi:bifunctional methylenetetrahydrofolate dehydrogenase/methenyltetrahydrofolate cyclohydrolase FolD [Acetonema longum]|uniref:Bifunctional protein FolD n=1 Tax=Acetonema longum DSM 6540 TaxID=1009370 RepID=F7NGT8_9FIRM|nr:bifunctional methylenetetrahydrofolate dehydrogenase/methenyltetrahydrofolate cyclohydrolase FolD [Acetonema longum]EGO64669.1 methenyltetrahydrofolate cyclohydrolase [Acetonema longum DSM 6540]